MRRLAGLLVFGALALSGCGPTVDPKLCEPDRQLVTGKDLQGNTLTPQAKEELAAKRDRSLVGRDYMKASKKGSPTLYLECPECQKAYDRLIAMGSIKRD